MHEPRKPEPELRLTKLKGGQLIYCHPPEVCEGEVCCVHAPSQHHMVEWSQNWRGDRGFMERICPHGVGHPDPDHMKWLRKRMEFRAYRAEWVHGCDGCCGKFLSERS